ncbi:hypothetical protein, partial [Klebsiella variicola]|uniref:hypothetical protein n=1 Tax=Klebsiella variicola TaxID=244366 RepID=UPI001C2692E4
AEATDNINNHTAVLPLTLALSRREREPSGWPRKRSAAGQDIRHGILDFAGWQLAPDPAYNPYHSNQSRFL